MKEICRELWIENHKPWWLLGKGVLLLLSLFEGILLRNYPYSIIWMFVLPALEITTMRLRGQVEYMLPRTREEMRRLVVGKAFLVAFVYSFANAFGYGLMISVSRRYRCDVELGLIVGYMFVAVFLMIFHYRLAFYCAGRAWGQTRGKRKNRSMNLESAGKVELGVSGIGHMLVLISCMMLVIFKLPMAEGSLILSMLQNHQWRYEIEMGLGLVTLVLIGITVYWDLRGLNLSEYTGA